jgi:hypothetical protein
VRTPHWIEIANKIKESNMNPAIVADELAESKRRLDQLLEKKRTQ